MRVIAIIGLACLLFACQKKKDEAVPVAVTKPASNGNEVTYSRHIKPIADSFCMACHNGHTYIIDLSTFERMKPLAEAGLMYERLFNKKDMPPYGSPKPSEAELKLIKDWLDSGNKP